ncbi:hypothetical protein KIW84_035619 [Lathyrus oleraceus]|uniref:Uncharacterized protein n=1 Tax=Pisum sativum TaxID=3888 RepID=A0A9D5B6W9_PEA|nr:hypothetical protein KIW84_035619 [Pisum sativum]
MVFPSSSHSFEDPIPSGSVHVQTEKENKQSVESITSIFHAGVFKCITSICLIMHDLDYGYLEFDAGLVRRRGADGRIPVRTLDRGASSSAVAAEPTGYPGGPYDTSLLVKYEHHVSRHIWFSEERGPKKELKVAGHGLKLTSRIPLALPPQMESWDSAKVKELGVYKRQVLVNKKNSNEIFCKRQREVLQKASSSTEKRPRIMGSDESLAREVEISKYS